LRTLGVDVGGARTGLALSDPLGITCRPLGILKLKDRQELAAAVADVAEREDASAIVVGLPRPLSGRENQQMRTVVAFIDRLRSATARPVFTWDERFTSKLAKQNRRPGELVDDVAACHLLQGYLDHAALVRSRPSE